MSSVEHDERVRKFWRVFWYVRLTISVFLTAAMVVFWSDQQRLIQVVTVMSAWALFTGDLPNGKAV